MLKNISNNRFMLSPVIRGILFGTSGILFGTAIGTIISYDKHKPYPPLSYKK